MKRQVALKDQYSVANKRMVGRGTQAGEPVLYLTSEALNSSEGGKNRIKTLHIFNTEICIPIAQVESKSL